MAPRPRANSHETHEEEIIGDSPTLEPYLHPTNVTEDDYDELNKEEESQDQISVIVGLIVALLMAILIVFICAAVIRRMRRRDRLPAPKQDGKGMRMKRVRRGKGIDSEEEDDFGPSPLDDLHDPYVQFVYIPPNRGLKLWKGRLKIMSRHVKKALLHKQIEIHGCTIPEHCRSQLKRIYVY